MSRNTFPEPQPDSASYDIFDKTLSGGAKKKCHQKLK